MRNSGKRVLALLAALVLTFTLLLPLTGLAFGDFDSGSDWGGSDSWSSSDYDYSDSSSSRSGRRSSKGSDGSMSALVGFFYLVVIISSIAAHVDKRKSEKQESERKSFNAIHAMEKLMAADPDFSPEGLIQYVKKLFIRMQECWEKGDITPLQDSFTHDLWTRYDIQLQQKNKIGETTHVRDISFQTVRFYDYRSLYGNEYLDVEIVADYNVWRTNQQGQNIMGSPSTRHRMTYIWTLTRPAGTKTGQQKGDMSHCPNCGAELDLNAFAECPFCHSMIEKPARNWMISRIQGVSQQTLHA